MLSILKLFEATTYAAPAESPMAGTREYVLSRMAALKKNFALGRISAPEYALQMTELRKNMRDRSMGVTKF